MPLLQFSRLLQITQLVSILAVPCGREMSSSTYCIFYYRTVSIFCCTYNRFPTFKFWNHCPV